MIHFIRSYLKANCIVLFIKNNIKNSFLPFDESTVAFFTPHKYMLISINNFHKQMIVKNAYRSIKNKQIYKSVIDYLII